MIPSLRIRPALPADVPLILDFIRRLAEYERLAHEVVATEEVLGESLFGARPGAEVVFAEWDGAPAGFALFFQNFSTFLGRPGIYLEDLFVEPAHRGRGIGRALLGHLARLARERAALALAEEATTARRVSGATWDALRTHFSDTEIVELVWANAAENYFNLQATAMGFESEGLARLAARGT